MTELRVELLLLHIQRGQFRTFATIFQRHDQLREEDPEGGQTQNQLEIIIIDLTWPGDASASGCDVWNDLLTPDKQTTTDKWMDQIIFVQNLYIKFMLSEVTRADSSVPAESQC